MDTNETTIYGTANQPKSEKKETGKKSWKAVSIGGVTGILMGGAAMYAANAAAQDGQQEEATEGGAVVGSHETAEGLKVAEVDQQLSFGEAFQAARGEVGAGGVFRWHGGIYNTYTEQEWNSMSSEEHQQFAQQVQPEITPDDLHSNAAPHHDTARHHQEPAHQESHHEENHDHKPEEHQTAHHEDKPDDEPEVHFLGVESMQTNDGSTINVGHMTIADQEVAVVDLDNDMVFDVAVSDRNQNNQIDDDEVIDISSRELTVTDFALASAMEGNDTGQDGHFDQASVQQDNLADDMPDYMNDADLQTL